MTEDRDASSRDSRGRFAKTFESVERDREACRLRSRGLTYQEISDRLGYGDDANARRAVKEVLTAIRVEGATELRALMAQHLDYLAAEVLKVFETRPPFVTQAGRIVKDEDGVPLVDHGPRLAAVDRLLRIQERKAKLLNIDMREQVTDDADVDAEIRQLLDSLDTGTETQTP